MKTTDTRHLSPSAQAALRERAVRAVLEHHQTITSVAQTLQVRRQSVSEWVNRVRQHGWESIAEQPRGVRPGPPLLTEQQTQQLLGAIEHHEPNDFELPGVLWTREHVRTYALKFFGIQRGIHCWGRWLKQQRFTPQKPARKATKRDDAEAEQWQTVTFPKLQAEAEKEEAEIHFLDEAGMRSDCLSGRTYAPQGQTPKIRVTGQRFRVNFIATLCVAGLLYFKTYQGRFNADMLILFLEQLLRERGEKKIHLVMDNPSVHTSKAVRAWAEKNRERIRLIFLPKYSPELNPVEYLNNDVKANVQKGQRAKDRDELDQQLKFYLNETKADQELVYRYYLAEEVLYAA